MAGLEVVVRPFIFPDIRPRARQSLPPQDDPDKGFAKIDGQPAKSVSMSYSMSVSSSHSKPQEVERRVDEVRVYQKEDDGTVNKNNFIDLQVANKITMEEPEQPGGGIGGPFLPSEGSGPAIGTSQMKEYFYERVNQQEANIEVKRVDVILRNGEEFKG
jgi:hypothetical protein